jgi:hypothetical protein
MKTITELRNYVNSNIRLDGYEHDQIFQMIDLFEKGLLEECKLKLLEEDTNANLYIIARIETLNKILQ